MAALLALGFEAGLKKLFSGLVVWFFLEVVLSYIWCFVTGADPLTEHTPFVVIFLLFNLAQFFSLKRLGIVGASEAADRRGVGRRRSPQRRLGELPVLLGGGGDLDEHLPGDGRAASPWRPRGLALPPAPTPAHPRTWLWVRSRPGPRGPRPGRRPAGQGVPRRRREEGLCRLVQRGSGGGAGRHHAGVCGGLQGLVGDLQRALEGELGVRLVSTPLGPVDAELVQHRAPDPRRHVGELGRHERQAGGAGLGQGRARRQDLVEVGGRGVPVAVGDLGEVRQDPHSAVKLG